MELLIKLNEYWGIYEVDGDYIPFPNKDLYCPICSSKLLLHDFRAYHHPGIEHNHIDVHLKCPGCGYWLTFGLPVPKEYLKRLQNSKYHGKTLRDELKEIYRLDDKVVNRLDSWGYW